MAFHYKQEYERYRRYYQSLEPLLARPSSKAYTMIIFSFLAVSLFGWFAIRPTMQTIFTLKRELKDKTLIAQKMEEKISLLIEAQAHYQDVEKNIPLLSQALPSTPDVVSAIAQIEKTAQKTNVILVNITVPASPIAGDSKKPGQKTDAPKKIEDVSISITISGAYSDVKEFLLSLESLRRIMTIDSMTIAPVVSVASPSATVSSNAVQVDLKLKLYYMSIL